ncbi:1,3-beta-glucanosyltransferase gas1 [Homalodisca vitripennis]|nr:1,3-beta-glucanosyltransferase gas1 [Homalodisca vitripennis]
MKVHIFYHRQGPLPPFQAKYSLQVFAQLNQLCTYVMFPLALVAALLWTGGDTFSHSRSHTVSCEEARLKCAYRTGCGMALQNYIVGCSTVLRDSAGACPESCQHALIALTSTDEGKDLMTVSPHSLSPNGLDRYN